MRCSAGLPFRVAALHHVRYQSSSGDCSFLVRVILRGGELISFRFDIADTRPDTEFQSEIKQKTCFRHQLEWCGIFFFQFPAAVRAQEKISTAPGRPRDAAQ